MRQLKTKFKKGIACVLTACIACGLFPAMSGGIMEVKAAEGDGMPSVAAYATVEQLKNSDNFALSASYNGMAKKAAFGKDGSGNTQYWYVAGADSVNDGLVLMAATPLVKDQQFQKTSVNNSKVEGTYTDTVPVEVYPNHYGSSSVRDTLQGLETNTKYFSAAEQGLMQPTTVYTYDRKNYSTYSTTDKLYLAYGSAYDQYITVGSNTADNRNEGLKIDIKNSAIGEGFSFWLRSTMSNNSGAACMAQTGAVVSGQWDVIGYHDVQPAFSFNLSSVLFASAVPAASTVSGTISNEDAFVMRIDGSTKLSGSVVSSTSSEVTVNPAANKTVTLVVQGNNGTKDWYYTTSVSSNKTVSASTIKSTLNLAAEPYLSDCEIWIETTEDNVTYAVKAVADTTEVVSAPEASVAAGTYTNNQSVVLSTKTAGATIYYTTDGSTPTTSSTAYTGAIAVTGKAGSSVTTTIKAIAVKSGMQNSKVSTYEYTINIPESTYSITVANDGNGTATASAKTATAGTQITLTATANNGYVFKEWQVVSGNVTVANNKFTMPSSDVTVKAVFEKIPNPVDEKKNGFVIEDGMKYWYEDDVKQGTEGRGKEIYDPESDAWYWLDAVQGGAVAAGKDVYQESSGGKWVRYDENGHMVKGWQTTEAGTYYFDLITGAMSKGEVNIDGVVYRFNDITGILLDMEFYTDENGNRFWYEGGVKQGTEGRGKEIYDPESDAWYWLDAIDGGKVATSKDVYQESWAGQFADREDGTGKWVRYDENGHMIKGWNQQNGNTYYFDMITGAMAKGNAQIDGAWYTFDIYTGIMQ